MDRRITIRAAETSADEDAYAPHSELWRDVPFGISGPDPTYESFLAEEPGDPAFTSAGTAPWKPICG